MDEIIADKLPLDVNINCLVNKRMISWKKNLIDLDPIFHVLILSVESFKH